MAGLNDFRTDYVYQDEKSGEFKNVQIKLLVDNDKIKLDMSADNLLSDEIIKNILHQLKELGGDYGFNSDFKTNPQGKAFLRSFGDKPDV